MRLSLPSVRAAVAGSGQRAAVLPNFRRQRSALERFVKHSGFLLCCVALGLAYGFLYTLFPPQWLIYLVLPIVVLALLVIWALPDTDRAPVGLLGRLFLAYFFVMILWPNYLAIALPGLPWMTLRRLVAFPMLGTLLICYSTSSRFRKEMAESIGAAKPLGYMIAAFSLVQVFTIFLSDAPAYSFNFTLNYWFSTTTAFFVAAWALTRRGQMRTFIWGIIGTTVLLCFVGLLEFRNQGVLWAGHIPSFLQVQDEVMQRYLAGNIRDREYRVVTTFSVSLALAEYLAMATPFFIHRLMKARGIGPILAWILADLLVLLAINLTQSRLGILGWVTAHVVYGCIWAFRRWRTQRADIIAPAVSLVYPVGALLFFIGMFTVPAIRNRTIGGGSTGFSDQARQVQFEMMWPRLFENPFGYGGGRSGEILGYRLPSGLLTIDSYVVTMVLDAGVLGLGLFAGAFIYAAAKMIQLAWRTKAGEVDLALPLACALVIAMQVRLVLSQTDNLPLLYMLLGMAAALLWRARQIGPETTDRRAT
jgi:uncharacterized membrane protein (UPF0136 family)